MDTTDGKKYLEVDMCACCRIDTGGNHEPYCPLYGQPREIREYGQFYIGGEVRKLSYPDSMAIYRLMVDRHPEWNVKEL